MTGKKEALLGEQRRCYDDIIDLPHHVSPTRPHMALADRAAQFLPFAALTGYGDAIRETGRLTDGKIELGEDAAGGLDGKLRALQERMESHPEVAVTYFLPDARKAGGAYATVTGRVRKLDAYARLLVMEDGTRIPLDEVVELDGEIF